MENTLISIPIRLGRDRTLHIQQKPKSGITTAGGLLGALQSITSSIASRSGAIHLQHVPADAPAVLDVLGAPGTSHDVQNDITDSAQTIVVHTAPAEPLQIYLRWPRDAVGLARLHLQTADYPIRSAIEAPPPPLARELLVETRSGSVAGPLPMEHLLDVSTSSGPVGITLLPLRLEKAASSECKLSVKTSSGSVGVNAAVDPANAHAHLPGRDCAVALQTSSGSIRAVLGLTRSVSVRSTSGSQNLTGVLRDMSRDRRSDFSSSTTSGSQSIAVVAAADLDTTNPPAAEKAAPAEKKAADTESGFVCKHAAGSGSVRVVYPPAWEGTVEARSGSGSVAVTGGGVETDRPARNRVTGVKGARPLHHTDVSTGSGSISVKFGEA
ncbi:hypothetical protein ISF_08805 [Cordyceps fumosorosea ARSEF 2679]|uniref:Adhesin domain-containing protein n=1 Tax=Cordyceps fumosorosea (strain ARSEF 2679) TaxID=1081104 RepID=A0A167LP61_CORFA|nr:hypothetical protein ISF_08805 [Cordyceps fumosorosea ARSEF 2679]OAA53324.1 hypothetical protein ISF_08805 [Cordyceps fumosorosea ARSEF 2679]